jgi:S1-C subfamily serine protease
VPDSPAAQRGLRPGDIITAVNRRPVQTIQDLSDIARTSNILFLLVQRGDRSLMLQVR